MIIRKITIVLAVFSQIIAYSQDINCSSFYPKPSKEYIISGWVQEEVISNVTTYSQYVGIDVSFFNNADNSQIGATQSFKVSGFIIDGWQRIIGKFTAPAEADSNIKIGLANNNPNGTDAFFDDIRVFPYNGTLKSFVYDEDTQRLMAELDENNYATYYEYDYEGGLVRVKKETEKGVYTIQETRSSTTKTE